MGRISDVVEGGYSIVPVHGFLTLDVLRVPFILLHGPPPLASGVPSLDAVVHQRPRLLYCCVATEVSEREAALCEWLGIHH